MAKAFEEVSFADAQKQLAPFVRSRQETIKIRWLLAAFLASHSESSGEDQVYCNFLSNPRDDQVRTIPLKHASGVRVDYLKAVQAYQNARLEHTKLRGSNDLKGSTPNRSAGHKTGDGIGPLSDYLDLLKERKRYERLKILTDYNGLLSAKSPAQSGYLDVSDIPDQQYITPYNGQSLKPLDSLQTLTAELDKAVLKAKHSLLAEQRMLHSVLDLSSQGQPRSSSQRQGLIRVRDELVGWVENELSHAVNLADPGNLEEDAVARNPRRVEGSVCAIRDTYHQYIDTRKLLLNAGNSSYDTLEDNSGKIEPVKSNFLLIEDSGIAGDVVSVLESIILPIHQQQKSIILQKSLVTTTIAKQQRSALHRTQALVKESALLSRFVDSKEGIQESMGTMDSTFRGQPKSRSGEEILELSSQWAMAADRARAELHETTIATVEQGHESIRLAQEQFQELQRLEGQASKVNNNVETLERDTEDIWTEDVRHARHRTRSRHQPRSRIHDGEESLGLWRKVNGRLGAIGDGV